MNILGSMVLAGQIMAGTAAFQDVAWAGDTSGCRVQREGSRVELHSPLFVFRLDATAGLRAQWWENRLTGRKISLGSGPELDFDIGLPESSLQTPQLEVSNVEVKARGEAGEVAFQLSAKEPAASAVVSYRWDAKQPVLRKFVTITNNSGKAWNRLLNVRLGSYRTEAKIMERATGFPVYLNEEFFVSLAHPAGQTTGKDGQLRLCHYPGAPVAPGKPSSPDAAVRRILFARPSPRHSGGIFADIRPSHATFTCTRSSRTVRSGLR